MGSLSKPGADLMDRIETAVEIKKPMSLKKVKK